jgi:hypothetical protein
MDTGASRIPIARAARVCFARDQRNKEVGSPDKRSDIRERFRSRPWISLSLIRTSDFDFKQPRLKHNFAFSPRIAPEFCEKLPLPSK